MAAGIGSMNFWYRRHDEDNLNPVLPPNTQDNSDPGEGWSNFNYRNFSAGYIRRDTKNNPVGVVSAYQRHDINNNPVGVVSAYQRHDEDNIDVPNPPDIPNS